MSVFCLIGMSISVTGLGIISVSPSSLRHKGQDGVELIVHFPIHAVWKVCEHPKVQCPVSAVMVSKQIEQSSIVYFWGGFQVGMDL